jgi:hypothetical protein
MKDWMEFHPEASPTDSYYLTLCNKVLKIIQLSPLKKVCGSNEEAILFAGILVAYFEDVISETKLFLSFTDQHKKLYGSYLPFYPTAEEYYPDEINLYDLHFLAWHVFSMWNRELKLGMIDPFFRDKLNVAATIGKIYDLFEDEFEKAPQNEKLQAFFYLPPRADVDAIRSRLDFFSGKLYLNRINYTAFMDELFGEMKESIRRENEENPDEDPITMLRKQEMYFYDSCVNYMFNHYSPILALRTNEALANLIGEKHPSHKLIKGISTRKFGYYLFRKEKETEYVFEHIPSGTGVNVSKEYIVLENETLVPGRTCISMGIVKWGKTWQQMGAAIGRDYSEDIYDDMIGVHIFDDPELLREIVKDMNTAFLNINQGKQITYLKGNRAFFDFYIRWMDEHAQISEEKTDSDEFQRVKEKLFSEMNALPKDEDKLVTFFFNPASGLEVYFPVTGFISDPDNPYAVPRGKYLLEELVTDNTYSKEFVNYLRENKLIEFSSSKKSGMEVSVILDNLDFLLRYYKREKYWTKPNITLKNV